MPTRDWPSITGSRRTPCLVIVDNASSTESSAPIVTVSDAVYSSTEVVPGSPPSATQRTTMSRSEITPCSRPRAAWLRGPHVAGRVKSHPCSPTSPESRGDPVGSVGPSLGLAPGLGLLRHVLCGGLALALHAL